MSTHTPGPWQAEADHSGMWFIFGPPRYEGVPIVLPDNEADARLIAAAPEMLEALKECEAYFRPMAEDGQYLAQQRIDRIRAAIAKATGEA